MSKYQFHRLGGDTFQEMVQALLEKKRRNVGGLIQFGSAGADGAREATWTQPPNHPDYVRPANCVTDEPRQWVFQVKFHDIGLRGWDGAGAAVVADLKSELEKITNKHKVLCHSFILITNVPLTGARRIGSRDKITSIAESHMAIIPNVEVWDAADLSRMLDNNADVRAGYDELILPGDVLHALYHEVNSNVERRESAFRGYLQYMIDNESKARAEEAGDDDALPLSNVFIDQTLQLEKQNIPDSYREVVATWLSDTSGDEESTALVPSDLDCVASSFPLLWGLQEKVMLLAGPGYGKSTITQFLVLYHASRIIKPSYARALAKRLKLPANWSPEHLDAACEMRFPFRIELRRFAKWRKGQSEDITRNGIASYIARQLIGGSVESSLTQDDIFALIASNPTLLILDGLDEVPNKDDRDELLKDCDAFLYRCAGENVDLQIVMSSRPQGYHGEFDRFQPLRWVINDLDQSDFDLYAAAWLSERIKNSEERGEAEERIKRGMASNAVRSLATTLLQATVMLTIVRKKSDIPEERHKLFEKYVDVVFQREKSKNELITQYERELRLVHEMVGYQIHEAVARGENGHLPESKFKDLVCNVWLLMRGDEQFQGVLNQELQKIYELSTDRLVFLTGKGSNQADIDFVIQPYREYFAAIYLSNHIAADPDKVFQCLVERGPYWQQVLRFYAAIAKPAQQTAWAYGAALQEVNQGESNEKVEGLRTRRAILFTLPEYGRFQFGQFRKTIAGVLPESEWWTWLGQEWAVPIICGLRTGEAWRELWKTYSQATKHPYGSTLFALWLFSQAIPNTAAEYPAFIEYISSLLKDPFLAKRVVVVSILQDLPIDLSQVDENTLFVALAEIPYTRRSRNGSFYTKLLARLPRPYAFRYLITTLQRFPIMEGQTDIWAYSGLPVRIENAESPEIDFSNGPQIAIERPYWLCVSVQKQSALPLSDQTNMGSLYETYLTALFDALQNPNDPTYYNSALALMRLLPETPGWNLRCETVLGPSPDQFSSPSEWVEYKTQVRELFGEKAELAAFNDTASTFRSGQDHRCYEWTTLLIPPAQWDHLVAAKLLPAKILAELRQKKWARLATLPRAYINLASTFVPYGSIQNAKLHIPFMQLLTVIVTLHNQGESVESVQAQDLLGLVDVSMLKAEEIHALIGTIQNPSEFPMTWALPLTEVASRVQSIDLRQLSDFWSALHNNRTEHKWSSIMYPRNTRELTEAHATITALVKLEDDDALDLAVSIGYHCPELPTETSFEMNRRAASALRNEKLSEYRKTSLVRCLFCSRQTLEEAELYADLNAFKSICNTGMTFTTEVVDRLFTMPQTLAKEHFPSLRSALNTLLSQSTDYPPEVCAAALDALIQIDIVSCPPLSEKDWQIEVI